MRHKNLFRGGTILNLTETSAKILEECGGKKYIDSNLQKLVVKINKNDIKSPMDVQNNAASAIIGEFDSYEFRPANNYTINDVAYNDETINITTVAFIMGIYLRDKYFEMHPDFLKKGDS